MANEVPVKERNRLRFLDKSLSKALRNAGRRRTLSLAFNWRSIKRLSSQSDRRGEPNQRENPDEPNEARVASITPFGRATIYKDNGNSY